MTTADCRKSMIFVGSAPLESNYSAVINSADCIVRFNDCKNFGGRSGTKTDILVLNNSGNPDHHPTLRFLLKNRGKSIFKRELPYLKQARKIWFVRPNPQLMLDFYREHIQSHNPYREAEIDDLKKNLDLARLIIDAQQIPEVKITKISYRLYHDTWHKLLEFGDAADALAPSTGLLGIEMVMANPDYAVFDKKIIGFNWDIWEGHPANLERKLIESYLQSGLLHHLDS